MDMKNDLYEKKNILFLSVINEKRVDIQTFQEEIEGKMKILYGFPILGLGQIYTMNKDHTNMAQMLLYCH
jgi:hypothetical protein